jgi:hypothetical protein
MLAVRGADRQRRLRKSRLRSPLFDLSILRRSLLAASGESDKGER